MIVQHHFAGGSYAKETFLYAGARVPQHRHPHDHLAVLAMGVVGLSIEGKPERMIEGPTCIVLDAHKDHTVRAVTDTVWYCVWATDDTDPETVDATILRGD